MKKELRDKIISHNRSIQDQKDKANDMDIIVSAFAKLPPGQLKKVLTDDVIAVFKKHGVSFD